jgi:hypothetical protein
VIFRSLIVIEIDIVERLIELKRLEIDFVAKDSFINKGEQQKCVNVWVCGREGRKKIDVGTMFISYSTGH